MRLLGLVGIIAAVWLLLKSRGKTAAVDSSASIAQPQASYSGDPLENFEQAIFQYEGGQPGDRNIVNNNPGNLKSAPGQTGTAGGFATFADQGDGWDALTEWVKRQASNHPYWDFYDLFSFYLRGKTNGPTTDEQGNSDAYAEYVANYGGWDPTQTVSSAMQG